jgi:hypothetical protein
VAAEIVSFAAGALAGFFADVVVVAAGVLELDELLPQPAAATASTGSIKIADIFFTKSSFGRRRHGRARIAATWARLQIARQ